MKWLYKWLHKKIYEVDRSDVKELSISPDSPGRRVDSEKTMNFNVTRANGGWVIEYRQYDRKADRNNSNLHIITDDKDLGEEVGKIITFENLYR